MPVSLSSTHHLVPHWADMHRIHDPHCQLVCWERPADPAIESLMPPLLAARLPPLRLTTSLPELPAHLEAYLSPLQTQCPEGANRLAADVLALSIGFAQLARVSRLRLLLSRVDTDMCRRFHTDINELRLLCTYHGPGTQWVAAEDLSADPDQIDPTHIRQVSAFGVAILKGALYPDSPVPGLLHRSPPVAAPGDARMLLRLDLDRSPWE